MAAKQQKGNKEPQVAMCTIAFREKLLEDVLDLARVLSFKAVELWGREPHVGDVYDYNRTRLIRRMCSDRGLEVAALGSYLRFGATKKTSDNVNLCHTLQTAHTLRASIIRVWASDVGSAQAGEEVWKKATAEAREACARCLKLGITLAVEMHDDTLADTAAGALRFLERVGCDNLRLNYQPSARVQKEKPLERLEKVLDYVVHCHAQNFKRLGRDEGDEPVRCSLRDGVVDYRRVVDLLRGAGYRGWFAVEFAHTEGDGKFRAMAEDRAFLEKLLS